MNVWQRMAVQQSSELVREAFSEIEDEVKTLRAENAKLKLDIEHLEFPCDQSTPKK